MAEEIENKDIEEVTDKTGQKSDSPTDKEGKKEDDPSASKEKPLPYDQDPKWKAAREAEKTLSSILENHDFDSPDDLQKALDEGSSLVQLLGTKDANQVKEILKLANKMKQYNEYWESEKEKKQRENEEPEETIKRLESQLKEKERKEKQNAAEMREQEENKAVLNRFCDDAENIVDDTEGLSKEESEIVKMFVGINNPVISVDLDDRAACKKTVRAQVKAMKTFLENVKKQAIEDYVSGKEKIPKIKSETEPAGGPGEGKEPKSLNDARKLAGERLVHMLRQANK